jgi:hypothetical protein
MTDVTARLALPMLSAGQAQKEIYHNEALAILDAAVQPVVQSIGLDSPPPSPTEGQSWIVGETPLGAWAGRGDQLATWTGGGWRFLAPLDGMAVWNAAGGVWTYRVAGEWQDGILPVSSLTIAGEQVLGGRQPAVVDPLGGPTVDVQARAAISAILGALRNHGLIAA